MRHEPIWPRAQFVGAGGQFAASRAPRKDKQTEKASSLCRSRCKGTQSAGGKQSALFVCWAVAKVSARADFASGRPTGLVSGSSWRRKSIFCPHDFGRRAFHFQALSAAPLPPALGGQQSRQAREPTSGLRAGKLLIRSSVFSAHFVQSRARFARVPARRGREMRPQTNHCPCSPHERPEKTPKSPPKLATNAQQATSRPANLIESVTRRPSGLADKLGLFGSKVKVKVCQS